jgi:cell division inhibitor SepF
MFGKKKQKPEVEKLGTAFERMRSYYLQSETSIFEQAIELANVLNENYPVLLNTEKLSNLADVNYVVAFLSGNVYGRGGVTYQLGKETFLFGIKESFEDGSLDSYIRDFGQKI